MSSGEFAQLVNRRKQQLREPQEEAAQYTPTQGEFAALVNARKSQLSQPIGEQPRQAQTTVEEMEVQPATISEQPEKRGILGGIKEAFTGSGRTTPETEAAPELATAIVRIQELKTLKARESFAPQELDAFKQRLRAEGLSYDALNAISEGVDPSILNKIGTALLFTQDADEQEKIIKKQIPEAKTRKDEKGNIIVSLKGMDVPLNKPGFSLQDFYNLEATTAAFTPAGRGVGLIAGTGGKIAAGVTGAAATQAAIEEAQRKAGGDFNKFQVFLAGLIGGAAEAAVPFIGSLVKGRQAAKLAVQKADLESAVKQIEPAREAIEGIKKATGKEVGLFRAQQTLDPTQLLKQRLLPQLDAGSRKAAQALEQQNKEVFEATAELLNTIAPADVVSTGSKRFQKAAQTAIEAAKQRRSAIVEPLYKEAIEAGADVDLTPVTRIIENNLANAPASGDLAKVMGKVKNLLGEGQRLENLQKITAKLQRVTSNIDDMLEKSGGSSLGNSAKRQVVKLKNALSDQIDNPNLTKLQKVKFELDDMLKKYDGNALGNKSRRQLVRLKDALSGQLEGPSLSRLQKVKFELDDMLEKFGGNALGNSTKRQVVQLKNALVDQMENASPLYKEANSRFSKMSPAVQELEDSIIGSVSRVKESNLKNISAKIFDATETNPEVLRRAKKVIDQVDPGAWDDLLRVEFQRRFAGIQSLADDLPGEIVGNVPAQLRRSLFGNPEKRRTLLSAMSEEQRKNFVYLDDVLRRASAGRAAGSPTAPFGEQIQRLKGVSAVIRDFIFTPVKTIGKTGEQGIFDRNVRKMTEVMFDPKFQPQLEKLRGMSPTSKKAGDLFRKMLEEAKAPAQAVKPQDED